MVENRPEHRNHRNQSTYKYPHPPGRRGANIRIFIPATNLAIKSEHMSGIGVAEKSDDQAFINLIPMRFAS